MLCDLYQHSAPTKLEIYASLWSSLHRSGSLWLRNAIQDLATLLLLCMTPDQHGDAQLTKTDIQPMKRLYKPIRRAKKATICIS